MVGMQISEGGITIPRWLAAIFVSVLIGLAGFVYQNTSNNTSSLGLHNDRISRLETLVLEQSSLRSTVASVNTDIAAIKKQQEYMNDKLDRLIEARGRK